MEKFFLLATLKHRLILKCLDLSDLDFKFLDSHRFFLSHINYAIKDTGRCWYFLNVFRNFNFSSNILSVCVRFSFAAKFIYIAETCILFFTYSPICFSTESNHNKKCFSFVVKILFIWYFVLISPQLRHVLFITPNLVFMRP